MDTNPTTTGSMNQTGNFLILTYTRTGSTSLTQLLKCHPRIDIISEPYNLGSNKPDYLQNLESPDSYQHSFKLLLENYTGIQHKLRCVTRAFNEHMIGYPGLKLVFLIRRNALQRTLSAMISQQSHSWDASRTAHLNFDFQPVPIIKLAREIENYKLELNYYWQIARTSGNQCCCIFHEDLFHHSVALQNKKDRIMELMDFIGYEVNDAGNFEEKIAAFVSPKKKKNTHEVYQRIPNIESIDKSLSNASNGFLFD